MVKKTKLKCKYCNYKHEQKREKCPAVGQLCKICEKKNHFQTVCKFKKKSIELVEKMEENPDVKTANLSLHKKMKYIS